LFNPDQSDKLKRIASDAVELEQWVIYKS
jgi:hypothetical protein